MKYVGKMQIFFESLQLFVVNAYVFSMHWYSEHTTNTPVYLEC